MLIVIVFLTLSVYSCTIPELAPQSFQTNDADSDITISPEKPESGGREERERITLTVSPANPADIAHIFPLGLMSGSHVTPVDHQYYYWNELDVPLERYPVFSPADGYVINVQFLNNDYIVFIEHSPSVQTEFIHLEKLVGPIAHLEGKVTWNKPVRVRVPVKAGELIAFDGGTNGFDFSVHDYGVTLNGFINSESYEVEPWKIHTVDPYDYFIEPVRSELLAKNVRQIEPFGGKIDYDIPGRLMGNWFVENTNGYAGLTQSTNPIKPDQQVGYWNTHLAIAPDPIDPNVIIVSLGWFNGQTAQLAIRDIDPPPEDASSETGLVKYELVDWSYVSGEGQKAWEGITRKFKNDIKVRKWDHVRGIVLFQLLDNERLKMEVFPEITAKETLSFTEKAKIYVR